jgi:hypothetical protein
VPLTSKNTSEVYQAFKSVYENRHSSLTYPRLLQTDNDNGSEWKKSVAQLMKEHNVTIRVVGQYSHRTLSIVECFNKSLAQILYAVESIKAGSPQVMAWVEHIPTVIDYSGPLSIVTPFWHI